MSELSIFCVGAATGIVIHWIAWFNEWKKRGDIENRLRILELGQKYDRQRLKSLGNKLEDTPTDRDRMQLNL